MLERREVPLAPLTTLGLGGSARRLVTAFDEHEAVQVLRSAAAAAEPVLVLAGGSNVVVGDDGFAGTVLRVGWHGVRLRRDGGQVEAVVAAGEPWDPFVADCVTSGLAGVECLSGIPGSTGATPVQNVGAYGQELSQVVTAVRAYDRQADEVVELPAPGCGFGYRTSLLKRDPSRWLVLAVRLRLAPSSLAAPIRYAELARRLAVAPGDRPPLAEVRAAVLELRRGKGMLVDPAEPDSRSAGSFFTNPVLPAEQAERVRAAVRRRLGDVSLPAYKEADGRTKLSAAWLIEAAGFRRGEPAGAVGLSSRHSLALVHRGGGSTAALLALAADVRDRVATLFEVQLQPEPVLVGASLRPGPVSPSP